MLAMLKTCFPHLKEDKDFKLRYAKWGGIPRYVMELLDEDSQGRLDKAASSADLDEIDRVLGGEQVDDGKASHRILHIQTRGEDPDWKPASIFSRPSLDPRYFAQWRVVPASVYVSRKLVDHFEKKCSTQFRQTLKGAGLAVHPSASAFIGGTLEPFALRELAKGGRFEVRLLSDTINPLDVNPETLTWKEFVKACEKKDPPIRCFVDVDPSSIVEFVDLEEIDPKSSQIQVPFSKTFCAVDAVLPSKVPCNVTINTEHKLILSGKREDRGLDPLVDHLNLKKRFAFSLVFS
jgi:hypothetical protein